MSKSISDVSLVDIMPQSLLDDSFVKAMAQAFDPELQAIAGQIPLVLIYSKIDELSEGAIDLLAWQLHCDFYESDLPLATKRALVKGSIAWHKHKGTPWAVERVISTVFANGKVTEWYEYGGDPYYFRVQCDAPMNLEDDIERLIRLINSTKNTRSWLDGITINRPLYLNIYYGAYMKDSLLTQIWPSAFVMPDINMAFYVGGVISSLQTTVIGLKADTIDSTVDVLTGGEPYWLLILG